MDVSLNIVELIENNPITRLSGTYQNKLLTKIKTNFIDNEQQMFVSSFYCYLNYNQRNDFVIDLDNVWKWIGFNQKYNAKYMLEKNFIIDNDYKIIAPEPSGAIKNDTQLPNQPIKLSANVRGGHNKEIIMLTIRTFKLFCLKSGTKKAEQIHEYYIKLEETLQEIIHEESNELKLQLEQKHVELHNQIITTDKDKEKIREKTLLEQFPHNTQCVYYGIIDNVSDNNEKLIKFGNSNHLKNRVTQHRDTYSNFRLVNAFKVENKLHIENTIKEHVLFIERQRTITLKNKKYIELLNIDGINFTDLDKIIKEIITNIEYSPENYIKILEHNKLLKTQLDQKYEHNNNHNFILLSSENNKLKVENIQLIKKYNNLKKKLCSDNDLETGQEQITQEEISNYGILIQTCKNYTTKNENGKYNIDGKIYNNLYGSRKNVWEGIAYKTSGCLTKNNLTINKNGNIISKKKCIQETINNRFEIYGVNKPNSFD